LLHYFARYFTRYFARYEKEVRYHGGVTAQ